jgi:hypothetical protein
MALYGTNLADTIVDGTTYAQGASICQILEPALTEAEGKASQGTAALIDKSIEASNVQQLYAALQDAWVNIHAIDTLIQQAAEQIGDWNQPMPADYLEMLKGRVAIASTALKLANDWYNLPSWSGISDGIVAILGGISNTIANAVSKVAGNLIAGLWPYLAGAVGIFIVIQLRPWERKRQPSLQGSRSRYRHLGAGRRPRRR